MVSPDRPFLLSMPTGNTSKVGIDRSRQLAWADVQRTDINQKLEPSADPTSSHWIHKLHYELGPTFLRGRVVDSIAYTNCYKVQFGLWGTAWCSMAMSTASVPIGSKQLGQLPVGCDVIVIWYREDLTGVILGVLPDIQTNSKASMADFISQQARSGLLVDEAHKYPICLPGASLITDWSAGRPLDATTEGEHGTITETGLLDFIDSFMTTKRVDEETGVWHFWHDQLTRVAGHNLQVWTAGSEREDLDDEGEFDKVEGHTPYYWEALGAFEFGLNVSRNIPAECWQKDPQLQGYSAVEPCDDHQAAFYRLRDFYGYLGQGHKRVLCLPPVHCSSSASPEFFDLDNPGGCSSAFCQLSSCIPHDLNLLNKEIVYPGVFEENLALTGGWSVRSAHEIILSKYVAIPAPKQMIRPEDPNGDNSDNYRAAGHPELGSGAMHKVSGAIATTGDDNSTQIRAAGFLDTHAFVFNWIGDHTFHYHEQDWLLPEEGGLKYLARDCHNVLFPPPSFDDLRCHHFLEAPPAIPIKVDHRYKEVNYYPNHSYFGMLADGGIVLGCGFGAEIKLANGHIWLTAPGDINIGTGRNFVTFAGYDVVLRAKNSWDISATEKDGRLKAKRNLWMVASGDCGGVLIQSKAKGIYKDTDKTGEDVSLGGIVLKAEDSLISHCANDLTFSLTANDGVMLFDAKTTGRIKHRAKFFERFIDSDGAALDFWTDGTKDVKKGTEQWQDGTIFCMPVIVNDKLLVADDLAAKGNLISLKGHVITKKAKSTQGKVGALIGPQSLESVFDNYDNRCKRLPDIGLGELNTLEQRANDYNLCDAEFTFRTVGQYHTEEYVLFESRWQQLARLGNIPVTVWAEEPVNDTYPYPGREKLTGETYRTLDPKLYDINTGIARTRGADYESPVFNEADKQVLNDNYIVIM